MYVCLKHTYIHSHVSNIHTYTLRFLRKNSVSSVYVWAKNPQPVMKTKHTYMLNFLRNSCFRRLLSMYVCSKSLCLSWKTLNQGSQKLSTTVFRLIMYVCLKKVQNPSACHAFCNSNLTETSEGHGLFEFSKRYKTIYLCMYVSLKATTSTCSGGCQIPYQNPSKSDA